MNGTRSKKRNFSKSDYTHETVPTKANGVRYAYRRFGKAGTIPLLFLEYFNSNMDGWNPAVTNSLARDHEVILFDNAGVGASGGETPSTVAEMTRDCLSFCRALSLKAIHLVGFSLGGMIAQQLALEHFHLIQRLILLRHDLAKVVDDGGTIINFGSLGSNMGTNIYSLAPNNVALKSVSIMSWFRLTQDEKQKDFELALNLATNHPELFEVVHEYEFGDFQKAIQRVSSPGKTGIVLLKNPV